MSFKNLSFRVNLAFFFLSIIEGCFGVGILAFLIQATGSVANANLLQSFFWISMTLAEIPTGMLADRWGPKRALLIAIFLRVIAFILFFFGAESLLILVAANVLAGIAVTFFTGTFSTQIKLVSRKHGLDCDFSFVSAQGAKFRYAGLVLGSLFGYSILVYNTLPTIWLGSAVVSVILGLYLLFYWEDVAGNPQQHFIRHIQWSLQKVKHRPVLFHSILINALVLFLTLSFVNNWVAIFIPGLEKTPGFLAFSIGAISLFRAIVASPYKAWFKVQVTRGHWLFLVLSLGMCTVFVSNFELKILMLLLAFASLTGVEIYLRTLILQHLPEDEAATISSIQSFLENFAGAAGFICLSWVLRFLSIEASWLICAAGILLLAGWVYVVSNPHDKNLG